METLSLSESHPIIEDAVNGYFLLHQHLFKLQELHTPMKAEWAGVIDARRQALNALASPCISGALMILNMLYQLGKDPFLNDFATLADITKKPAHRVQSYNHLLQFSVAGVCILFQFQVENLFQNIWRELGKNFDSQYLRLSGNLLDQLGLKSEERLDKLKFLAYIRNSLHNNGIHKDSDWNYLIQIKLETELGPIVISGNQEFAKSNIVECSPITALAAFCGVLEVVIDILCSHKVSSIPGPILDLRSVQD